jgi:hypothetical protein
MSGPICGCCDPDREWDNWLPHTRHSVADGFAVKQTNHQVGESRYMSGV